MRTEVTWPEAEVGDGTGTVAPARPRQGRRRPVRPAHLPPHPEAARFLRAVTLGQPLVPVALLRTVRERTELRTSDGRSLAEIDRVQCDRPGSADGRRDVGRPGAGGPSAPGAASGPVADQEIRFVEVEVELAEGSSQEVLEAVAHRLRQAGARPSDRRSKVATVLNMAAASDGPGAPGAGGAKSSPGAGRPGGTGGPPLARPDVRRAGRAGRGVPGHPTGP